MTLSLIGPVYPYRGGISHFTSSLTRAFCELNIDLQVISFKRQYPKWLYPGESDLDPSQVHDSIPAEFILDPLEPHTWLKASKSILAHKSNLAIIEWWTIFWAPAYYMLCKYMRRRGVGIIFLIHNVLPHEQKSWDQIVTKLVLTQGDGFLVQTERERQKLVEIIGVHDNIRVQHHPIYDFNRSDKISKKQARQILGLPEDAPIILFFGIVRPYKGLGILLESLHVLNQSGNYFVVVAGEFWQNENEYQLQIQRLGLDDHVKIFNYYIPNEELPIFFTAADIFTAPYLEGTQSGTTSMAIGFGSKIVVSDKVARGITEENLSSIVTVPAGDPAALAEGIQRAYHEDNKVERLSIDGQDWQEFARVLLSLAS
jgi:glycosyltransferase involved in cell wall biosynthesis